MDTKIAETWRSRIRLFLIDMQSKLMGVAHAMVCMTPPWKSAIWRDPSTVLTFRVFGKYNNFRAGELKKTGILGLNGVAVARHGPILKDSEAAGSRKVSRYLPDLRDTIFDPTNRNKYKKVSKIQFYRKFPYIYRCLFGVSCWCHSCCLVLTGKRTFEKCVHYA